jgi:hypothetical protein
MIAHWLTHWLAPAVVVYRSTSVFARGASWRWCGARRLLLPPPARHAQANHRDSVARLREVPGHNEFWFPTCRCYLLTTM